MLLKARASSLQRASMGFFVRVFLRVGFKGWVGGGMGGLQKLITDLDTRNGYKEGA